MSQSVETAEKVDLETDPATLAFVVYGGRPLADAVRAGSLAIVGDRALAEIFVTLIPLPAKLG